MALAWAGVVLRAGEVPALRRALDLLAPAGRMTLTLYLSQSLLVLSLAFNGYGLDLGDRLGHRGRRGARRRPVAACRWCWPPCGSGPSPWARWRR